MKKDKLVKGQKDMKVRADVLEKSSKRRNFSIQKFERASSLADEIALVPGGMKEFLSWLRAAALRNKTYEPFLESFFQLPASKQNAIELEEMAFTYGISPATMLGDAVEIAYEKKRVLTKLIASVSLPAVVARNIHEAKKADGIEDRRMFLTGAGFLPTPKGSTVNVSANANAAAAMTTDGAPSGLPDFDDSVVSLSEVIRKATESQIFSSGSEPIDAPILEDGE